MICYVKLFFLLATVPSVICLDMPSHFDDAQGLCGCKVMRHCYAKMLDELREQDESRCLDPVEMGISTIMVYLRALTRYCGHMVNLTADHTTYEERFLYEVHLHLPRDPKNIDYNDLPVIMIEAGQGAGIEPVQTAMMTIEHLVACEEHEHLMTDFRWVILPCVNPDGLEYVRFDRPRWRKNTRKHEGQSLGIDITRNFDAHWNTCGKNVNGYSRRYPGPAPESEFETKFVLDAFARHKNYIKAYLSLKRDGHGIFYPHAYTDKTDDVSERTIRVAELISNKVNQRGGNLQTFLNSSINAWVGRPKCGSSVDYVFSQGIELAFEMRVGLGQELEFISKLLKLDPAHHNSVVGAYFSGIKELASIVRSDFEDEKSDDN